MTESQNKNYVILNMFKVSTLENGEVYTGKIKFGDLKDIYKYTEREENNEDILNQSFEDRRKRINSEFFQRKFSPSRQTEIKNYLAASLKRKGKIDSFFPTSIILYNRKYNFDDYQEIIGVEIEDKDHLDHLEEETIARLDCAFTFETNAANDQWTVYIPRVAFTTLIVDGQHRFAGTQALWEETSDIRLKQEIENFEFIVTYLVGFDLYEVAKIFANVNFQQKRVNKSLYYDIFGSALWADEEIDDHNEIRFSHELAQHLNINDKSVLKGMIKLLGKGSGLFSQAFFVDALLKYVFKKKVWNKSLLDYINRKDDYKVIASFMRQYFEAIKESYESQWPKPDENGLYKSSAYDYSILCKTTGMAAYIRLIKDIYPLVEKDAENFKYNIKKIFSQSNERKISELLEKYKGRGSAGDQGKLYYALKQEYNLRTNDEKFIQDNLFK